MDLTEGNGKEVPAIVVVLQFAIVAVAGRL